MPQARAAPDQTPASDEGYCTVRVADVARVDSVGATYAVVLAPTVPGDAVLSGTIAFFSEDDRRFDVPFAAVPISSTGKPEPLRYRFPAPVVLTGAYVASLDAPSPGPCAVADPWTSALPPLPPQSDAAQAVAHIDSAAVPATMVDSGRSDPMTCPHPFEPARTIRAVPPTATVAAAGKISVLVTVAANGRATAASVEAMSSSIASDRNVEFLRAQAVASAEQSTYETATFRCKHIIGTYLFVVEFRMAR